jgi:hypothetical protein
MAARREDAKIAAMSAASVLAARLNLQSLFMRRQNHRSER